MTMNEEKPLLIFRVNGPTPIYRLIQIRNEIVNQIEENGIVVLPSYITVEYCKQVDCNIKVISSDGKIVE